MMQVTLIVATTVDGFIARSADHFTDWTEAEDKRFFHEKTKSIGTVIMGANTFRTLQGSLSDRLTIVMSSSEEFLDPILGVLEFYSGNPADLLDALEKRGISEVALVGGSQVAASFLLEGRIDEMYVTVSPLLFGQGISVTSGYNFETRLRLLDYAPIGDNSVLLHYEVVK